jgi:hypothetical protein
MTNGGGHRVWHGSRMTQDQTRRSFTREWETASHKVNTAAAVQSQSAAGMTRLLRSGRVRRYH